MILWHLMCEWWATSLYSFRHLVVLVPTVFKS
jgi:hypothetical protein